MSYANKCDINTLITENEPKTMIYNGMDCQNPDGGSDGYRYLSPGTYGCGYAGCDNSQNIWNDAIDGMWVPPNQYVWMWNNFQRDIGVNNARDVSNESKRHLDWSESQGDGYGNGNINLCPVGQSVTGVDRIYYGNTSQTCGSNINTNEDAGKFMMAKNNMNPREILNRIPDTCYGQVKTARIDYRCGNTNIFIPTHRPDGVYGPGMYDPISVQGEFDNDPNYLPDTYFNKGGRIARNSADTILVRRTRPWRDHLRNCCFQTNANPMNSRLCGNFDGKTDTGRQYCKSFLTECSADDIKLGGKCYNLCRSNPGECDVIKQRFCQSHPTDPFCDCINYQSRQDYIDFTNKYPVLKSYPRSCTYNKCRLTDQDQIFLTQDIIAEAKNSGACADVNQIINNINGSNNVITGLTQSISTGGNSGSSSIPSTTQTPTSSLITSLTTPLSPSATGISMYITPLNLLLIFIVLIVTGYLIYGESDDTYIMPNNQQFIQQQQYMPNNQQFIQ